MKKILFFKKADGECMGVSADRLNGVYRNADTQITFFFDDMLNKTATCSKVVVTMSDEDEDWGREYFEDLANEISYGKSPVITIYDKVKDSGFRNVGSVFSDLTITVTNG